jgi:MFS transporter, ACS family, tartrate transporter
MLRSDPESNNKAEANRALAISGLLSFPLITMVALTFAAMGTFATFSVIWTLPTSFLAGTAAACGIAMINSIGNLAGFGGPYLIGWVKEATRSATNGLLILALLPLIAGVIVVFVGHDSNKEFGRKNEVSEVN